VDRRPGLAGRGEARAIPVDRLGDRLSAEEVDGEGYPRGEACGAEREARGARLGRLILELPRAHDDKRDNGGYHEENAAWDEIIKVRLRGRAEEPAVLHINGPREGLRREEEAREPGDGRGRGPAG
jgi:hypothetical protein